MFSLLRLPRPLLRQAVRKIGVRSRRPTVASFGFGKHCAASFRVEEGQGGDGPKTGCLLSGSIIALKRGKSTLILGD